MRKAASGQLAAFQLTAGMGHTCSNRIIPSWLQQSRGVPVFDLGWLVNAAELCGRAYAAGKTLIQWRISRLGKLEKEILKAAAENGEVDLVPIDGVQVVVAGNREFASDDDPAVAAEYADAFTQLCDRGLLTHHGEDGVFRLTGGAFKIARKLASEKLRVVNRQEST